MAMHCRQPFDANPPSLALIDQSSTLRSVFRRAVGYALASAIGVSGCYGTSDQPSAQPGSLPSGSADRGPVQGDRGLAAVTPAEPNIASNSPSSGTPQAMPTAGAAAPMPSPNQPTAGNPSGGVPSRAAPVTVTCKVNSGGPQLFTGLTPAQPFDAAEYRVQAMSLLEPQIWFTQGVLCDTAGDRAACEAEVGRAADESNLLWNNALPMYGTIAQYVLTTRGAEVRKYQSRAELLQFLGPIDSPEDVLLLLFYDHLHVPCAEPMANTSFSGIVPSSMRERDDGYEILFLNQQFSCFGNSVERVTLLVATDGTVTELARDKMTESKGCEGRRPEGLRSQHLGKGASALGEHFARMAHLEHASVAAFDVLALELAEHGAPEELIAWACRSASDEVRHTAITRELAHRFDANPTEAEVVARPLRSLEAIAIENAREGCVRECYGAALGWYQAHSSSDVDIAAAMAQIADDETNHAALAFAVDAWACSRLDERSRARVAAARAEAVTTLRCELSLAPDPSTREALGLPDAIGALRLCTVLEQSLWA
jgi:hypothetical protein